MLISYLIADRTNVFNDDYLLLTQMFKATDICNAKDLDVN